ncbi:MAG: sigma-70 family RNA polymerase sigma factor [Acidobacteria bacterium]|nr:sigma-70 family RNA polymerase sigma factor [Acidobacteriota bacterium]
MKTPDSRWVQQAIAEFEEPLIRYAAHITRDVERAREVVQDTFLKLCHQQPAQVRHLAQWLYTVCRNRALDVLRKERRMTELSDAQLELQSRSGPDVSTALEHEEQLSDILKVLSTLPANQQEVIRLKFQADLSYVEISRITNLTVSNVGFLIHTGLKTIRERVRMQPALRRVK